MWRKIRFIVFSFLLVASFALPSMTASASLMELDTDQLNEGNGNNNENDAITVEEGNDNVENGENAGNTENEADNGNNENGNENNNENNDEASNDANNEVNNNENGDEENANENEDGNNEENEASPVCEGLLQVHLNEETEVCASQEIIIDETEDKIIMPDDLPEGTTLKVSPWANDIEGFEKVGSVYTFTLTLPDGTGHEGQFELSLYYNSELYEEQADIYYSSDGEEWLVQNGTKEGNHITVSVDGFSKYGVLVPEEAAAVCEDEQTIQFGDTIEVCAGQKIDIADTLDVIVMPEDLPDDSTLTINDFSESAEIEELEQFLRCGGVYEVLLETPEATAYNEPFTMIMNYCNGESADDIYFFNEDEDDWVKQDGEFDYDTFTISIEATLNGKYGVFALGYDLTEETEESKTKDEVIVIDKDKDEENKDENKVYVVANDEEDEDERTGFILPSTATNLFNFILIGAGLLLVGGIIIFFARKSKVSKE